MPRPPPTAAGAEEEEEEEAGGGGGGGGASASRKAARRLGLLSVRSGRGSPVMSDGCIGWRKITSSSAAVEVEA